MILTMFLLSVVCGCGGAVLRALELQDAFLHYPPGTTGDDHLSAGLNGLLKEPWHPLTLALLGLSVAFAVAMLLLARRAKKQDIWPTSGKLPWLLRAAAGTVLLATAAYDIADALRQGGGLTAHLLYSVLTLLAAGCVLWPALRGLSGHEAAQYSMTYLVPIFWCCFRLIIAFFENSSNPTTASYVYDLLTSAALLMAAYYLAGLYFRQKRSGTMRFCAGLTVYLGLIGLFSPIIFRLMGNAANTLPALSYLKSFNFDAVVDSAGILRHSLVNAGVSLFAVLYGLSMLFTTAAMGAREPAVEQPAEPTPTEPLEEHPEPMAEAVNDDAPFVAEDGDDALDDISL